MVFEKGWFLHKMNKFAPKGYKFVARGKEGRIALCSKEFMGNQEPTGPFISCFSFEMLDMLFGGLLTRRIGGINQGAAVAEYMHMHDVAQLPIYAKTQQAAESLQAKYRIYRSIIGQYMSEFKSKPRALFINENALLIQGLQDSKAFLPENLSKRLHKYVNKSVWYAIESVFASMPIVDMNYYQDLYRKKMQSLKVDTNNDYALQQQQQRIKLCKELEVKIKQYKEVPLRWWQDALIRAQVEHADTQTLSHIQYMIDKFSAKIKNLEVLLQKNTPTPVYAPACDILYDVFHDKTGKRIVPKISDNYAMQMLQLACMREHKINSK